MDKDTQYRLEKGREHYDNREYDKAEPYLLKVAESHDGFADVMNMLGVIYHDKGQVALAQEFFEKAMRINPQYTEAALNLAVVYSEQGLYEQARQIHEHVTSLRPAAKKEIEPFARGKLANMHADLGRAYAELHLVDQAVAQYRASLELSPEFVDIRTRLGQTLKDAGDLAGALVEFDKVKALRPKYVPARVSLGVTYFAMGRREQARKEWQEVLDLDPENKTAGMYLRMVEQLLAQQEAADAGIGIEVEQPQEADSGAGEAEGELDFSFDGHTSSVMPAAHDDDEPQPEHAAGADDNDAK